MKWKRAYSSVASQMCGRANDVFIPPHPTPPPPPTAHPTTHAPTQHTQCMTRPEKLRHVLEAVGKIGKFPGVVINAVGNNNIYIHLHFPRYIKSIEHPHVESIILFFEFWPCSYLSDSFGGITNGLPEDLRQMQAQVLQALGARDCHQRKLSRWFLVLESISPCF